LKLLIATNSSAVNFLVIELFSSPCTLKLRVSCLCLSRSRKWNIFFSCSTRHTIKGHVFYTSPLIWRLLNPLKSEETWIFFPAIGPKPLCTFLTQNYYGMKMEGSVPLDPLFMLGQSHTEKLTLILLMWRIERAPYSIPIYSYIQQDVTLHSLFISGNCYMFRVVLPPIIRSAYYCIYSIWYLSHRYCYLPLSWKSWNWFECAVGGVSGR
jgi:hypothetical protein